MLGQRSRRKTSDGAPGSGRSYGGFYMARVVDIEDPQQIGRIKVKVFGVGGESVLAWARVAGALGGDATGCVVVPEVDAFVYVGFEAEDENRPLVLGSLWFNDGGSQLPLTALGLVDDVRTGRGVDTAAGPAGIVLTEPVDPYAPLYPKNKVYKSSSGHLIEADDTEGAERISITHGTSKSWLEFHPSGAVVLGCKGERYTIVEGKDSIHVTGDRNVVVDGGSSHKTTGDCRSSFGTYRSQINGLASVQCIGALTASFLSATITVTANLTLQCAGVTTIGPGSAPGAAVTILTHPVDYITGLPILGVPSVLLG